MSLLEWLGESHNPGPQGSFNFEKPDHGRGPGPTRGNVVSRFALALALVGIGVFFLVMMDPTIADHAPVLLGAFVVYFVLAYFARPEPDTSNVGWFGGLVDDPFRYSDDVNRFLFALRIVLLPGRFISEAFVEFFRLFRGS